ncbi:MAG: sugar phosphate isomerase/epimerase [Saprospiraceae bacterium]|nr:sugar phosphate isomerase/epimerase [Saprospiraceae bacterium]
MTLSLSKEGSGSSFNSKHPVFWQIIDFTLSDLVTKDKSNDEEVMIDRSSRLFFGGITYLGGKLNEVNRRKFINNISVLGGVYSIAGTWVDAPAGSSYKIKTSCNMYSFNKLITEGTKTLAEAIEICGELGFDAVDPTGYYFEGYPEIPSDKLIYSIKHTAFVNGMAISGTGIRNDFTLPEKEERRKQVEFAKRWIEVAAKLDAPVIRLFAGPKIPEGHDVEEVKKWVIDCLHPCIEFAENHGVIVTLQNHFDALQSMEDVKSVLDKIDSAWFGLNLDIGSLRLGDPYQQISTLVPYARTWQIKEKVYRDNVPEVTDIPKLMQIIKDGGYRGYIPLETLPPSDPLIRLESFLREIEDAI